MARISHLLSRPLPVLTLLSLGCKHSTEPTTVSELRLWTHVGPHGISTATNGVDVKGTIIAGTTYVHRGKNSCA
jgi:hypothetical protein